MKTRLLSLLLFLGFCIPVLTYAQQFNIRGTVEDTLGNPLIAATVLLMDPDSIMMDFTSTEMNGSFKFSNVEPGDYIVKSTYVSYIPVTRDVSSTGDHVDLGVLSMKELAEELMTVVIKAAKASIVMRGDTIEYDASTFRVPEGSTVEDLLRRLPGIEIERDGAILAEGQNVDKVTVDGKSFFGADPKAATKNLPAEGISKVQVFDSKTETEEITGATGQSETKTMNLELKEAFKKGSFGRIVAGVGTESRAELKGNINRFNDKIQFSLVGVGNNTGRNGLSWNDYQDFMGSQAFSFNQGTDYGFSGGSGFRTFRFGGGDGGIESNIQSIFFSGRDQGFPVNYNTGANFNYDNKKTKLSGVYFYNRNKLTRSTTSLNDRFYPDLIRSAQSEGDYTDQSDGHRMELSLEHKIDSFHTVKVDFNGAVVDQNDENTGFTTLSENEDVRRTTDYRNTSNLSGHLLNGTAILRKKFRKKGRSMGLNASILSTELDDDWTQQSQIINFRDGGNEEENLDRFNQDHAEKTQFKANALYVEPLSKRLFFQTFYNFSQRDESGEQAVFDVNENNQVKNAALSSTYDNDIDMNRLGGEIRYSHEGLNISAGAAYQSFSLAGSTLLGSGTTPTTFSDNFNNWIPNATLSYRPIRNASMNLSLSRDANEPDIEDLKAVIDYTNPNYIKTGNPNLTPEIANRASIRLRRNFVEKGVMLSLSLSGSTLENGFSVSENVDDNLVTTYTPINIDGGREASLRAGFNFPIKMNKFTINTRFRTSRNEDPTIVNGQENLTTRINHAPSITFNITPWDEFTLFIDGSYNFSKSEYDLNPLLNQETKVISAAAELNSKLFSGLYINTSFDYNRYKNDRFSEDRTIPILNASIYRQFLKGNRMEARLSVYDALNKNVGFSQFANNLGINQARTTTLARYFMFSLTYNIRGLKSDIKKNRWW